MGIELEIPADWQLKNADGSAVSYRDLTDEQITELALAFVAALEFKRDRERMH